MKKIFLSLSVFALAITTSFAQLATQADAKAATKAAAVRQTPETKAADFTSQLSTEVGLKDNQIGSVKAILTDFFTKARALKSESGTTDAKVLEAKKKQLRESRNTQLKTVLTAEQWTKFLAFQKKENAEKKASR